MLAAGCALQIAGPGGATATPFIITSTLPPTVIPSATLTPIPPTPSPTSVPVEGTTTTQVNVRADPSSTGAQLGMLAPFVKVKITGIDAGGDWFQVQYAQGPGGYGWIASQYISVQTGKDKIPVIGGSTSPEPSPNASETPIAGGTIIQQVNVRKGPGAQFDSLGTVNAKDSVALLGKDADGSWLQIKYPAAPNGKGWVIATYVQAADLGRLPIIAEIGAVLGTSTAASTQTVLAPTPAVALQDNDSAQAPATNVTFSSSGTRSFIYSSDLSAPSGDTQDWVQFTPYGPSLLISLNCAVNWNGKITLHITENGSVPLNWSGISCGETKALDISPQQVCLAQISIVPDGDASTYVRYSLRVESTG